MFFSINNHKIINLLFCRKPFYGMNKLLIGHQFFSLRGMKKGLQIDFVTWYHVEVWSHFKPKTFDTLHVLSVLTLLFALWIERKNCVEKHCNILCSCPGTAFYCMFTHSPANKKIASQTRLIMYRSQTAVPIMGTDNTQRLGNK